MSKTSDVIIIGGGIAGATVVQRSGQDETGWLTVLCVGLGAALELKKAGIKVTVLEARDVRTHPDHVTVA